MALCYDGQLIRTYNDSKARFVIRDNKFAFSRDLHAIPRKVSCFKSPNTRMMHVHASISDRNLSSTRMTVNARRLCFTANITSDSRFQSLTLARNASYGDITHSTRRISYRNDGRLTMRECVRAQTDIAERLLFGLRDPAFPPSRKFRGSLLRGVPRWLLLPLKDAFSWFRRDIFPQREGNVRYKRAGVEYEMRATDLFKGQARHPVCRITL